MNDPELRRICFDHGVFLRREAKALGYSDNVIDAMVRRGEFHRVRWGSYAFSDTWSRMGETERYAVLCRAAQRRANTEVVLSHASSGNEWALPLLGHDLTTVHLHRRDGRAGRKEAGITQHKGGLVEGDVQELHGLFVMSPTRTVLEMSTLVDVEHGLVAVDHALHHGLTTPALLAGRFALMNHWPATLRTDLVLFLADGRSESVGETRIRYLCWAQGLPTPIPNYPIRDRDGRVIHRVDLAWPELGLFLEFDGKEKYLRHRRKDESVVDCVLREKARESLVCELTGWRCIRVVWADLYSPRETANRIRALMRQRQPHPTPAR